MDKYNFTKKIRRPLVPTSTGARTLRARLSLRETQEEFSKRFRVTRMTIQHWESGKSLHIQKVHKEMLDKLILNLQKDGMWMPEDVFIVVFRTEIEKKGNALL